MKPTEPIFIKENINSGIGASSSAMAGASIVVNLAAILQKPNTLDENSIGKYSEIIRVLILKVLERLNLIKITIISKTTELF